METNVTTKKEKDTLSTPPLRAGACPLGPALSLKAEPELRIAQDYYNSCDDILEEESKKSNDDTSDLVVGKAPPSTTGDKSPQTEARDGAVGITAGYHATEYSKDSAPEGEAFKPFRSNNGAGVDSSFVNHVSQDTNRDISGRVMIVSQTKVSRKYNLCYPIYENGKMLIQGFSGYPLTFKKDEDWRKDEKLGCGAFGACWSIIARDKWDMVVKEPRVVKTEDCCKEVETMVKMGQHANVVTFYGATYENQMIYIFMELIRGGTMTNRMDGYYQRKEKIDIELICIWMIQIMRGLVHLHRNGIAHHDFHAGNILLDAKREEIRICLADFGNSRVRCDECKSCNELSIYGQSCVGCVSSVCGECAEWKDGRIDDIRKIAILVYQLISVPSKVDRDRVWKEGVKSIGRRDKILSRFAAECMKLKPTQSLLEILTPQFPGTSEVECNELAVTISTRNTMSKYL